MTTSRCPSRPSTQLPLKRPLQPPPKQSLTIAYLLCCGAKHLYVDGSSTATEPNEVSQQQIK
jgi:hypothetical protein